MKLKVIKIISCILVFIACFPFHFMYDWFPNTLFSVLFPVNESIWEHMKILFSSLIFIGIIESLFLKEYKNYFESLFVSSLCSIPIFLIIYYPLYLIFGENFIMNIAILFITIIISEYLSYYILKNCNSNNLNGISIIGIVLVYIVFGILTYFPPTNDLFYDYNSNKYGVHSYKLKNK